MVYGLIGETLKHSFSKDIHESLRSYTYELFSVPRDEFDTFIGARKFNGLNVTIPYKRAIIPHLSTISPCAEEIGSVNTVTVDKDGGLHGYNTDYNGMMYALSSAGISLHGKKVVILGSGGTSLTAQYVAKQCGANSVKVVSRSGEFNYENISEVSDGEIVINTTPVGMYPNNGETPVDLYTFPKCEGAFDAIYNPLRTKFISDAESLGIPSVNGLAMLVAQAKYAGDIFTGTELNDSEIDTVVHAMERRFENVVIVGMPGCGKSTIGQLLAEKLDKTFVDIDEKIVEEEGTPIPDIFRAHGEQYFRDLEAEIVARYSKETNQVIATGGGSVIRDVNREALISNGFIVWLKRDLVDLPTSGRPLSIDLKKMYGVREPIYRSICHIEVKNPDGELERVTTEIIKKQGSRSSRSRRKIK